MSKFTVPLVEKYAIKVGVLTLIWLTMYQLSSDNHDIKQHYRDMRISVIAQP